MKSKLYYFQAQIRISPETDHVQNKHTGKTVAVVTLVVRLVSGEW